MKFLGSRLILSRWIVVIIGLAPVTATAQDADYKEVINHPTVSPQPLSPSSAAPVTPAPNPPEAVDDQALEVITGERPPSLLDEAEMVEEIDRLELERQLLSARAALAKEKLSAEQRQRREVLEREKLEMEERNHRMQQAALERKELLERDVRSLLDETERLKAEKDASATRADVKLNGLRLAESEMKAKLSTLTLDLAAREKELAAKLYTDNAPQYDADPLHGDALVISDRRIALNGVITARTATDVSARIQYYNNQDATKPIFLVIDDSPGGSVMAGYHILKAMEGSEAPVYAVVKQFAASMAACITTLADRSFAYPNAILLHHQISSGIRGNLTQQREGLAEVEEWWRRLADPVAKKMGISTDDFIKQMYDKVSTGDWSEFADSAQRLKWVDHVVNEIRETGQQKHPDAPRVVAPARTLLPTFSPSRSLEIEGSSPGIDAEGRPYLVLPRPNPIDKFYLHNPDSYYRFR